VTTPLQQGTFLIAKPSLTDPNFKRTVVLIVSYDEQGTLGVVVNRPTTITYKDALAEQIPEIEGMLFHGGPVEVHRLFILHRLGPEIPDSQSICDGIHFSGDIRAAWDGQASSSLEPAFRGYLGCAGWGPGQLEDEMRQSAWILCHASAAAVFHDEPEKLWVELLSGMGGEYAMYAMMPPDPELN